MRRPGRVRPAAVEFHHVREHLGHGDTRADVDAGPVERALQVAARLVAHRGSGGAAAEGDGEVGALLGDLGGGVDTGQARAAGDDGAALAQGFEPRREVGVNAYGVRTDSARAAGARSPSRVKAWSAAPGTRVRSAVLPSA